MSDLNTPSIRHRPLTLGGPPQYRQPSMGEGSVLPTPFNLPDGGAEGERKFEQLPVSEENFLTPPPPPPFEPPGGDVETEPKVKQLSSSLSSLHRDGNSSKTFFPIAKEKSLSELTRSPVGRGGESYEIIQQDSERHLDDFDKSRARKALADKGWLVAAMVLGLMASYPLILQPTYHVAGDLIRRMRGITVPKAEG